eukprot:SAG22_NODE_22_length_31438_cov_47.016529_13_plen_79_part_00
MHGHGHGHWPLPVGLAACILLVCAAAGAELRIRGRGRRGPMMPADGHGDGGLSPSAMRIPPDPAAFAIGAAAGRHGRP